jgi:hypothetical protein
MHDSCLLQVNVTAQKFATSQVGRVNGVGQTLASLVRGLGPALGGTLWSLSVASELPGSYFLVFAVISLSAGLTCCLYSAVDGAVNSI